MLNLQRKWFGLGSCWMLLWWHRHPQKKLVGGWTTQPKNMRKSNWIISPGIGVKIKNSWNHHLNNLDVFAACLFYHATFPPLSTPPLIWWFFWSLCKKHEKATLPTIWRCISYTKRGFSIAMLAYRRVSGKLSWTWFWKKTTMMAPFLSDLAIT